MNSVPDKAALERGNWQAAHAWHQGLALEHRGVDLGDALTFIVLEVLGRAGKRALDTLRADQADEAGANDGRGE